MGKMYLVKAFEKTQNNPLTYKSICTVHAHRDSVTHRTLRDKSSLRETEKPQLATKVLIKCNIFCNDYQNIY